jgi:hypothetical protein
LAGCDADVYLACDSVQSAVGIVRRMRDVRSEAEIQASLARLVESKLVASRDGHLLALGILRNRPVDFFDAPAPTVSYVPKTTNPESLLRVF